MNHLSTQIWQRSGGLVLASVLCLLCACSSRPRPDGVTGLDFAVQLNKPGVESLVKKQGSAPLTGSEKVSLLAGWFVIGVLLEAVGTDFQGPAVPLSTEVRLSILDENRKVVASRSLSWGNNEWHESLWPGSYTIVVDVTGNRGTARLKSPTLPLKSGERLTIDFELRPPEDVAPPEP